jgi:rhodanese-related sulfurtransferase
MTRSFYNRAPFAQTGASVQFFIDNALLIAVAFVSGGMLLWPLLRSRAAGPALTTLQATQLINGKHAQVIDVRDAAEFARGSLPSAKNIPLAELGTRGPKELKKDRPVIVLCNAGNIAGRAAAQLRAAGLAEVYVLAGGLNAWREAGLPLKT